MVSIFDYFAWNDRSALINLANNGLWGRKKLA